MSAADVEALFALASAGPPTFRQVAAELGWSEDADRVDRWAGQDYEGHWTDPEYDLPRPTGPDGSSTVDRQEIPGGSR